MEVMQDANPRDLSPMEFHYPSFMKGVWAMMPAMVGVIPFAVITGVLVSGVGFTFGNGLLMTFTAYAGASQVAAMDMISKHTPVGVIIFTALIINLRFIMYSAASGPYLKGLSAPRKILCSFILSDQSFAVTSLDHNDPNSRLHRYSYFLGTSLCMFAAWNVTVPIGMFLGKGVPASWQLDFAIPLTFLALLIPALRERTHLCAALAGGIVAVAGSGLPSGLGLLLGSIAGIVTGFTLEKTRLNRERARAKAGPKEGGS